MTERRAPYITEILTLSRRGGLPIRSTINRTLLGEVLAARWLEGLSRDPRSIVMGTLRKTKGDGHGN